MVHNKEANAKQKAMPRRAILFPENILKYLKQKIEMPTFTIIK